MARSFIERGVPLGDSKQSQKQGGFLITQIKQISGRIFEKLLQNAGSADDRIHMNRW